MAKKQVERVYVYLTAFIIGMPLIVAPYRLQQYLVYIQVKMSPEFVLNIFIIIASIYLLEPT